MSARNKISFVAPIRLLNMIWLPIMLGLISAVHHYGTPHLRVQYVWSGARSAPIYHDCQYWGLHSFRLQPLTGNCPLILLARSSKER